jgi:SET domain-containing protein
MAAHAPGIGVGRSHRGRGVVALRRFREGDVIETCPTIVLTDDDLAGRMRDYVFDARERGKYLLVLGFGMLYNHSSNPNVIHRTAGRQLIEFVAIRDIEKGEELTHDYGPDYWNDRGREPR